MKTIMLMLFLLSYSAEEVKIEENLNDYSYTQSEKEYQILDDINQYREERGLNSLGMVEYLSYKCFEHNKTMITLNQISHSGFQYRAKEIKAKMNTLKVGECVSKGFDNPVPHWIASDGHRAILETAEFTRIGISFKEDYCTIILIK